MSRARLRAGLSAAGLVGVVSLARADAPPGQYGLFNSGTLSIFDNGTKLRWQRQPSTTKMTFAAAASYCSGLSLDTYTGWRVPSYKELLTLVDENPHDEYEGGALVPHAIDPNAFVGTPVDSAYWTSSPYPEDPNNPSAYAVDFHAGQGLQEGLTQPLYVRCVHD